MTTPITRRKFAALAAAPAAAPLAATSLAAGAADDSPVSAYAATGAFSTLSVRPYRLMCIVCRLGGGRDSSSRDARLAALLAAIRQDRKQPITLRSTTDHVYRYQNPGLADNTPEGELFNQKRDLDILQRMGLVPGDTRPAIDLFERLLTHVTTSRGICGYDVETSAAWRGCGRAASGDYEKGRAKGVGGVFAPRDANAKAESKKASVAEIRQAKTLRLRPHHLMCVSCFYGGSKTLAPLVEDNLFEAIEAIRKQPDIPVTLVAGCCMICPPCSAYDPQSNLCLGGRSMALRDQKKDLDVLQRLGLQYGDTLPARRLYRLLFERVRSTREICGFGDGKATSPEWSVCGSVARDEAYQRARTEQLGIPG